MRRGSSLSLSLSPSRIFSLWRAAEMKREEKIKLLVDMHRMESVLSPDIVATCTQPRYHIGFRPAVFSVILLVYTLCHKMILYFN
jgi:hypothetical protein